MVSWCLEFDNPGAVPVVNNTNNDSDINNDKDKNKYKINFL